MKIEGTHPYADAWPMLGDEELSELAEDIAANGLRDPIVVYGSLILDGRNRFKACELANVEPTVTEFDGGDDDALAFVQSVNNARRHQSKGSLAASWALSMLAASKRQDNGRWAYKVRGSKSQNSDFSTETRRVLGLIADHAPDLLYQVRDDSMSLNAAYTQAEKVRDAERHRLEREERIAAEEAEAKAFIESEAPELAEQVGGFFRSYAEARAVWEKRNREEAERLAAEKRAKEKAEADRRAAIASKYTGIGDAIRVFSGYGDYDDPMQIMADYSPDLLSPPEMSRNFTPEAIAAAHRFTTTLTEWSKSR